MLIGKAAELLDKTIYDIYRLAKERDIELGVTETHYKKSKENCKRVNKVNSDHSVKCIGSIAKEFTVSAS